MGRLKIRKMVSIDLNHAVLLGFSSSYFYHIDFLFKLALRQQILKSGTVIYDYKDNKKIELM